MNNKKIRKRIIFILPALAHPRHHKRINALRKEYDIKIYAFQRGVYEINVLQKIDVNVIGEIENKNYLGRMNNLKKVFSIIRKENKPNTLFYFFSLDIAMIGTLLLKKDNYIYEIGDFAYLGLNKLLRSTFMVFDYNVMKRSLVTVFTSHGFLQYLQLKEYNLAKEKSIVIPNKPSNEIMKFNRSREPFKDLKSLRFGFVGVLRYQNTILRFIRIIGEKYPSHSFVYFGDGGLKEEFLELCEVYPNLQYGGVFKNPDDLKRIYNDFDIHIACYDTKGINQKIAEPNKLYESIYFGNPLIASRHSFFGQRTKELRAGFEVDATTDENIIKFIDSLDLDELNDIRNRMLSIPVDELITSHTELIDKISRHKNK